MRTLLAHMCLMLHQGNAIIYAHSIRTANDQRVPELAWIECA